MARERLLILDDDAAVGQILALMGQTCGCDTRWCETPAEFLQTLADWAPTHLAIDLSLADTSGVEVLRQVAVVERPAPHGADLAAPGGSGAGGLPQVIVCSGAGRSELDAALQECQALGLRVAGALPKPFRLAQVRSLLAGTA